MSKASKMKMQAEERAERYREAGIAVNNSSMWHNPWTGGAEYDVDNHGPGLYWTCELCDETIIEDDTCPDCDWTLEEQEG